MNPNLSCRLVVRVGCAKRVVDALSWEDDKYPHMQFVIVCLSSIYSTAMDKIAV